VLDGSISAAVWCTAVLSSPGISRELESPSSPVCILAAVCRTWGTVCCCWRYCTPLWSVHGKARALEWPGVGAVWYRLRGPLVSGSKECVISSGTVCFCPRRPLHKVLISTTSNPKLHGPFRLSLFPRKTLLRFPRAPWV
jgi:hypothetical protein